jgi:hypothetical protein
MYHQSTDRRTVHSVSAMYQKTIDYYHGHQPTMHDGDNDEEREPVHDDNEEQEVTLDELPKALEKLQFQVVSLAKEINMRQNQIVGMNNQISFLTSMSNQHVTNICQLRQAYDCLNEKVLGGVYHMTGPSPKGSFDHHHGYYPYHHEQYPYHRHQSTMYDGNNEEREPPVEVIAVAANDE